MKADPEAQIIWKAARSLNQNPLDALGIPNELDIDTALFILEMDNPEITKEADLDKQAEALKSANVIRKAWSDATAAHGKGYQGVRSLPPIPKRHPKQFESRGEPEWLTRTSKLA